MTPDTIFQQLKAMNLGSRKPKRWKAHLPKLRDQDGALVQGRLELDRVWLQYFGEQELGEKMATTDFIDKAVAEGNAGVSYTPDADLLPKLSEIEVGWRATKTNKAAGLDGIPGELLKFAPHSLLQFCSPLCGSQS